LSAQDPGHDHSGGATAAEQRSPGLLAAAPALTGVSTACSADVMVSTVLWYRFLLTATAQRLALATSGMPAR
jgi:hypothetical protein